MKKPTIKQAIAVLMLFAVLIAVWIAIAASDKKTATGDFAVTEFDASLKGNEIVKEIHYTKCCMVQIDVVTKVGEDTRGGLFTYVEYNGDGTHLSETVTEISFADIGKTAKQYTEYCLVNHH